MIADAAKKAHGSQCEGDPGRGQGQRHRLGDREQYLAMTRSQVVADELAKDGVNPEIVQQVPIGQTGSDDPSVAERRVDIVVER